jgi:hypothetical protein
MKNTDQKKCVPINICIESLIYFGKFWAALKIFNYNTVRENIYFELDSDWRLLISFLTQEFKRFVKCDIYITRSKIVPLSFK